MHSRLPRSAPAVLIAGGLLALTFTGGAFAAGLVTGAQIKDSTVTTADMKDGTLRTRDLSDTARSSLRGVTGVTKVDQVKEQVPPHAFETLSATCPAGKVAIGAGASWTNATLTPSTWMDQSDPKTWHAQGENPNSQDEDLRLTVWCVARS
ncbi:MAG: hypothetical protein ACRDOX_02965 [Nocardioides sp.]